MSTPLLFFFLTSVLLLLSSVVNSRPQKGQTLEVARSVDVSHKTNQHKVEVIESKIPNEKNTVESPVITTPTHIPQHLLNLLLEKKVEEFALGGGEHLLVYPLNDNTACNLKAPCARFQFKLSSDSRPISSMHIWIQKKIESLPLDMVACSSTSLEEEQPCEKLYEVKYESAWSVFEIPFKFLLNPRTDSLFITVEIVGLSMQEYGDQKPFIVANLNPTAATRKRRSINDGSSKDSTCGLVDYYISFKELGWSWIVSPLGFNANMCYGKCSYQLDSYPSHYHKLMSTILKNKATSVENKVGVWEPHCSPTKLKPLEVIYAPNDSMNMNSSSSFTVQRIPDMITESCGCL